MGGFGQEVFEGLQLCFEQNKHHVHDEEIGENKSRKYFFYFIFFLWGFGGGDRWTVAATSLETEPSWRGLHGLHVFLFMSVHELV